MANMVDKKCKSVEYFTPPEILDPIREYFGGSIGLDPATSEKNPTEAELYVTEDGNGLESSWLVKDSQSIEPFTFFSPVFVNPPFGKVIQEWCKKIHEEASKGVHIVALLPGQRFETKYWQEHILNDHLRAICFIRKRITFLSAEGNPLKNNPYGSMLYLFNGDPWKFADHVGNLGKVTQFTELKPSPKSGGQGK